MGIDYAILDERAERKPSKCFSKIYSSYKIMSLLNIYSTNSHKSINEIIKAGIKHDEDMGNIFDGFYPNWEYISSKHHFIKSRD